MISLLDSLQGFKTITAVGRRHEGFLSRGEEKAHGPMCAACKTAQRHTTKSGKILSYCSGCWCDIARRYRKKERDKRMCGPKGAGSGGNRTTLCPKCKINSRGWSKSSRPRGYCKPCDRKKPSI